MNIEFKVEVEDIRGLNGTIKEYTIKALLEGETIGYLRAEEQRNANLLKLAGPDKVLSKSVYIGMVNIHPDYMQKGIATLLYKEFGKLYKEYFKGWDVLHMFSNSISDYLYRKSVANGDIPKEAYNLNYFFKDDMSDINNSNWRKLRVKLPKEYQGNANEWDYEELYGAE